MDDDPDKVRQLLEPMGYEWLDRTRNYYDKWVEDFEADGCFVRSPELGRDATSEDLALADALNRKDLTGARIADLDALDVGVKRSDGKWRATLMRPDGHTYVVFEDADTPDEAIAALWLSVYDLTDPRKETTT